MGWGLAPAPCAALERLAAVPTGQFCAGHRPVLCHRVGSRRRLSAGPSGYCTGNDLRAAVRWVGVGRARVPQTVPGLVLVPHPSADPPSKPRPSPPRLEGPVLR